MAGFGAKDGSLRLVALMVNLPAVCLYMPMMGLLQKSILTVLSHTFLPFIATLMV